MPKLSIIIPVYNEERTIAQVVDCVLSTALPPDMEREIVIVDDGSKDRTKEVLKPYQDHPLVKIYHQENQGKTAALLSGIARVTGDIILIQDADLEYNPAQYGVLLLPILEKKADVVYGSRFLGSIQKMFFINKMANIISNATLRLFYRVAITDVNTCFKVFRKDVLRGIHICSKNFAFETEVTVKLIKRGVKITEVPIDYVARTAQEGKKIGWLSALEMFWPILKYRFFNDSLRSRV